MLRPTVVRPVCTGIKHPSATYDQILITVWQLRFCFCGAPTLTRGRVFLCICYWPLPVQSLGLRPFGLETIFYGLRSETSLSIASYDSQGHGGGNRPRLHTGYWLAAMSLSLSLMLRPTVSRPVFPGIKHPSAAYDQIVITAWELRFCFCKAPSMTRGWACILYVLLALASAVLGSEALCLETIFYCFRFETSLFVASYDSQGHHGGNRPRFHTRYRLAALLSCDSLYNSRTDNIEEGTVA
jgi:hypothetical protein